MRLEYIVDAEFIAYFIWLLESIHNMDKVPEILKPLLIISKVTIRRIE